VAALQAGLAPAVHELGGIGTGDLTALAEVGLALAGERPWLPPPPPRDPRNPAASAPSSAPAPAAAPPAASAPPAAAPLAAAAPAPVRFGRRDGLALMSSSALTLAVSALGAVDMGQRLGAAEAVVALSHLALRGDTAAYDPRVAAARGHPGQVAASANLMRLLDGPRPAPVRLQDPLSLRCAPQVHGAAREALADLESVLAVELNAAGENPLLVARDGEALHHGNFDTTRLGLSLDLARAALERVAALSVARLAALVDPSRGGLPGFLADATPASSGILILEYTAHAALAELRATLGPVPAGAVLALGQEDAAPFTPTAARRLRAALEAFTTVVAAEAVAAVRALRLLDLPGLPPAAAEVLARLAAELPADLRDRPLDGDVAATAAVLAKLPAAG
jgi:histidine ammonia-lyase